jgi:hypothetical protein
MKKLSQRELLQEDFADMVRAAGRVAADIYAPVIKPIKDALNAWESPEKALREYVKNTPSIRITKIISTKPIKAGSSGGRIGIPLPTAGLTKGRYGTNIYQILFEAEMYNPETGLFERAYTSSMPTEPLRAPTEEAPTEEAPTEEAPTEEAPKVYRADIERISGKYRVVGIYNSKGEQVYLGSSPRGKSPEDLVKDLFDGDSNYTFKFIKYINQFRVNTQTGVKFEAYYDPNGRFSSGTPKDDYVAIITANNKSIVKVYRVSDPTKTSIPYYT